MSDLMYTVLGVSLAAALVTTGGFIVNSMSQGDGSASSKSDKKATVTLIVALPYEHYNTEMYDFYKRDKYTMIKKAYALTDGQMQAVRDYTYEGLKFEKAKSHFEKLGQDHKDHWKQIIVTFDNVAERYAQANRPAVVAGFGDSVAYLQKGAPFMVKHVVLSPVIPVPGYVFDTETTLGLYEALKKPYADSDANMTDITWSKFEHPGVRAVLDANRTALE